ncbi:MAG TPA: archaemetzincin family Zn-dependent metalloprotease [Patescibacteria group bacterium]|nr:archaemetzincin family Zn-dependent metalloprotease [Patescibacteria group bacterium]
MSDAITLVPIGFVDTELVSTLRQALISSFSVEIHPEQAVPYQAFDRKRGQYQAEKIFEFLCSVPLDTSQKIVGIIEGDLYAPGYHYMFGQADVRRNVAVVSLMRLHPVFDTGKENEKLFFERVLKEVVHELGHLYGCGHCQDASCVMFFSRHIKDTDHKGISFCSYHEQCVSL